MVKRRGGGKRRVPISIVRRRNKGKRVDPISVMPSSGELAQESGGLLAREESFRHEE